MIPIHYRPLTDRSWLRKIRRQSAFRSDWQSTSRALGDELERLKADDVTLELDVVWAAIRSDGMGLKANQSPASPAVALSFDVPKLGRLVYRADALVAPPYGPGRGQSWRHNVRAIALTLEALRAVERHGVLSTEQYRGNLLELEGPTRMSTGEAAEILRMWSAVPVSRIVNGSDGEAREAHRLARIATHPDRWDGDRNRWDAVETAAEVLGIAGVPL